MECDVGTTGRKRCALQRYRFCNDAIASAWLTRWLSILYCTNILLSLRRMCTRQAQRFQGVRGSTERQTRVMVMRSFGSFSLAQRSVNWAAQGYSRRAETSHHVGTEVRDLCMRLTSIDNHTSQRGNTPAGGPTVSPHC